MSSAYPLWGIEQQTPVLAHRGSSTQGAVSIIRTAAKAHQTYVTAHTDYLMLYVSRDPGPLLLAHVLFS